jgi:hypothetical protein
MAHPALTAASGSGALEPADTPLRGPVRRAVAMAGGLLRPGRG